jgi:hypothetical protein
VFIKVFEHPPVGNILFFNHNKHNHQCSKDL